MIAEFGRFRLDSHRREFLADGAPVAIGSRAFDVLIVLIEAGGELVTKEELLRRVWPARTVEDNALQFQISTLRSALGPDRGLIRTSSGRGYRLLAEISFSAGRDGGNSEPLAAPTGRLSDSLPTNLSQSMSKLIGREADLSNLEDFVLSHRLVTLVGTGGIGKTRLVSALGWRLFPKFADGVWAVELGPLSDPELVLPTVAEALGLVGRPATAERLAAALATKQLLLVIDNCEHVIDTAARIAEAFLGASISLQLIATSREPLRVEGEFVYRVPPLSVPATGSKDMDEVLRHGAVELFVARAQAAEPRLLLDAHTTDAVAKISRHLDGIPLAIELAAARAATLGVEGLASRLDDIFNLLTDGLRTAEGRQQTLRATLDWSYNLLSDAERVVMPRLAVFAGGFTMEAASYVATGGEISDVVHHLSNLVTKSLVVSDIGGTTARYRLLETTRAYGLEKLAQIGEFEPVARRHAEYYLRLFENRAVVVSESAALELDNVRAALSWAFSSSSDVLIGIRLTEAVVPLWVRMSMMSECRTFVSKALASSGPRASFGAETEMRLQAALGASLTYTTGPVSETVAAWSRVLELAESLNDTEYQLQGLRGLWAYRMNRGEYRASLENATEFCRLAELQGDPKITGVGNRMAALILHYLGQQSDARRRLEPIPEGLAPILQTPPITRFLLDQRVAARALLARILWLQGFPDQAMRITENVVKVAEASGHAISLCHALAQAACPIALWTGDLAGADRFVAMLIEQASQKSLEGWIARGQCFKGALLIQRGDWAAGSAYLQPALQTLGVVGSSVEYPMFLAALSRGLALMGQIGEGQAAINEAIDLSQKTEEHWCAPELFRVRGELLLLSNKADTNAAEDDFSRSLSMAQSQKVLSWELRAAASAACLERHRGPGGKARELLGSIYKRFSEGFETADLRSAKLLIDEHI